MKTRAFKRTVIAMLGLGPRGLGVLERLLKLAGSASFKELTMRIDVYEPGVPGAGVHLINQPKYLTLNTPTGQMTQYPGDAYGDPELGRNGPSLLESMEADGHVNVEPAGYASRQYLGLYCSKTFKRLLETVPSNVELRVVRNLVERVERNGNGYFVVTEAAGTHHTDFLILASGHGRPAVRTGTGRAGGSPYPAKKWEAVPAGSIIAIEGMGLAAFDVIAALMHGRGGRFERCGNDLVYRLSGNEPKILMYSRNGIPAAARVKLAPELRCEPCRLVRSRILVMREERGGSLSLGGDLWPLMKEEVTASYYLACLRLAQGEAVAMEERGHVNRLAAGGAFEAWAGMMAVVYGPFDAEFFLRPSLGDDLQCTQAFQARVRTHLAHDIANTRSGLAASPEKFAAEALKRARPGICQAVNFGGLDEASWREFHQKISPLINRVAIGPELLRVEELLALVDAGVVSFTLGPNPVRTVSAGGKTVLRPRHWGDPAVTVDYHCAAHLPPLHLADGPDGLVAALLQPLFGKTALAGVQIGSDFEVYDPATGLGYGIWLHGQICEGITYYNNYVATLPADGAPCPIFSEVHSVAWAVLTSAKKRVPLPDAVLPRA